MEPEYINLIRLLNEEGAEYIVFGGHAVIAHGYLLTTGDVETKSHWQTAGFTGS